MVRAEFSVMPCGRIERAVELGKLGEQLGYERCWVYDEGLAAHDAYVTMTAIACATQTLQIGPGITNPHTRHVGITAGAIAALDELSGGRAFMGIGAGGRLTLDPLGIVARRPLTAVREAIDACRRLYAGDVVSYDGRFVRLCSASLPHARPDTEIWLAGRGPKMLELGGAACDGVMLDFVYKPDLAQIVNRIRSAGQAAGNKPRIAYSTLLVTDDASMQCARANMTYRLVDSPAHVRDAIGMSPEDARGVSDALADGLESAARGLRDEWILPFVIAGTAAQCAEELWRLADEHGIEAFVVPLLEDGLAESSLAVSAAILQIEK